MNKGADFQMFGHPLKPLEAACSKQLDLKLHQEHAKCLFGLTTPAATGVARFLELNDLYPVGGV